MTTYSRYWRQIAMAAALLGLSALKARAAPAVQEMVGGGNLEAGLAGAQLEPMYEALRGVGARLGRVNSYAWRRPDGTPTPETLDKVMVQSWKNRITPMILLEYYGSYQTAVPPQPVGSYDQWFAAGAALAARFRPGGTWSQLNGAADWGVRVFSAMNEPDVEQSIPRQAYHDALAGLADGVHSVDAQLKVVPGGFASCNSHWDATLGGYGPAIADLLDAGKLDGIDLHTYYHQRWFPLEQGRHFSAQACFDAVKKVAGIHRDIAFYATEMNVAKIGWPDPAMDDARAARLFLTGLWDNLGVVGQDGHSPVAALVFPWNLSTTPDMPESRYAMSLHHHPWAGDSRAVALQFALKLSHAMRVRSVDLSRGEMVLEGGGQTLLVWHDRPGWTDHPGAETTLSIPAGTRHIEVWAADGLKKTLDAVAGNQLAIRGLSPGQTFMFLCRM